MDTKVENVPNGAKFEFYLEAIIQHESFMDLAS